ncbi:MAG: DUF4080 domain-containing protein [Phycisphaeraceae bacterium]|nr:DUF4080 domain-containing protein [Phycisphaeraceae bacterium]
MTDSNSRIILATINARYAHAAFGIRYLQANLGRWESQSRIIEFTLEQNPIDIAHAILAHRPRIVGLGVYIWNARQSEELVGVLKALAPDVIIILGGPEVSHETDRQSICSLADYTVCGEADLAFAQLVDSILRDKPPASSIIRAPTPPLADLAYPYRLYDDHDLAHRVVYVEASRGCPYTCEFCLSSLPLPVRSFPIEAFLKEMEQLIERGARQFKFVDRTFNLSYRTSAAILEFFLQHIHHGLFLHFEVVPDRLPEALRKLIAIFPPGVLQFEIGIQTFDPKVAETISRKQNYQRTIENLQWLRNNTHAHLHTDLIFGLPGEDMAGFARGFDKLVALQPHEIQVGILKRLRGTPISRHDEAFSMVYSPYPPYEVLQTDRVSFEEVQSIRRFARYWDLVSNSGRFVPILPRLLAGPSAFDAFARFSQWAWERTGRAWAIALPKLQELVWTWLAERVPGGERELAPMMLACLELGGRRDIPDWLGRWLDRETIIAFGRRASSKKGADRRQRASESLPRTSPGTPTRQRRFLASAPSSRPSVQSSSESPPAP